MAGIIAYRNLVDGLVPGSTLTSNGDIDPNYPLSNLQTRQLSDVCKMWPVSSGSGAHRITCDFGSVRDIRLVALFGIDKVDPTGGWQIVQVEYSRDGINWLSADVDIVDDAGVPDLPTCAVFVPRRNGLDITPPSTHGKVGIRARYVRVAPGWVSTEPSGWRVIGRLWIGDALVLDNGIDDNWTLGVVERGELDVTDGGQAYEEKRDRTRTLGVSLSDMDTATAFGFSDSDADADDAMSVQGMQIEAGCTGEVVVIPRATDSALWVRRLGIYGHIDASQVPEIRKQAGAYYATNFTVVEER
jgi:hypothetical protein